MEIKINVTEMKIQLCDNKRRWLNNFIAPVIH